MDKNEEVLKEIKEERQKLETLKNELLFIKQNLEDTTPKIDVSDVYVWKKEELHSIVKLNAEKSYTNTPGSGVYSGILFKYMLIDIFTNKTIYTATTKNTLGNTKDIKRIDLKKWENYGLKGKGGELTYLTPIYKIDNSILAYVDKKVPLYHLQHLYYRLNDVNISSYVLKKQK